MEVINSGASQMDFMKVLHSTTWSKCRFLQLYQQPIHTECSLDVATGETALVYSALIGRITRGTGCPPLPLTPEFEIRPLSGRASMIMEMPAFAARYGQAMPEVDFVTIEMEIYQAGLDHTVRVGLWSLWC